MAVSTAATDTGASLAIASETIDAGEDVVFDAWEALQSAVRALSTRGNATRVGAALAGDVIRVVLGRSDIDYPERDGRFADPTWRDNSAYRRLGHIYIALCRRLEQLVDEADLDWRSRERARFAINVLTSTVAPTNTLPGNPAAIKRAFETSGRSVGRGLRHFVKDMRENGGMPSQVDKTKFAVGENLAATPGGVIYRDDVCEVLQYAPTTERIRVRPVLCVPPQINKHYIADMSPGRSLAEYMVGRGIPFFIVSWRNPDARHRDWDLDTYAAAVLKAIEAVLQVSGSDDLDVLGLCAGGITLTSAVNRLAADGDERIASLSLAVTLLDLGTPTMIGMFASPRVLDLARRRSAKRGLIDARSLASMFLWVRPNDLIWNYWVNNYLMGNDPPAFDILAWNADGTNLPAKLHAQFLEIFADNLLVQPGALTVLGAPVDYRTIGCDLYVVGGTTDHLTPWRATYRTTQLFGGQATFVLSNTGHVQTVVCPPGGGKAHHFVGPEPGADPDAWLSSASRRQDTWWAHWAEWLLARSATDRKAPTRLGNRRQPVLDAAPGRYVLDQPVSG